MPKVLHQLIILYYMLLLRENFLIMPMCAWLASPSWSSNFNFWPNFGFENFKIVEFSWETDKVVQKNFCESQNNFCTPKKIFGSISQKLTICPTLFGGGGKGPFPPPQNEISVLFKKYANRSLIRPFLTFSVIFVLQYKFSCRGKLLIS